MKIVFFGTPQFAVASLAAILESSHEVVGVVTATDKPAGRNLAIKYSEVKSFALEKNLPLLQPQRLKDETFLQQLRQWNADIFVIVAFRIMPEIVWSMPPLGSINLHASLLPNYRGAAPINWAIIKGETETGVTTFQLKQEMDTGDLYLQKKVPITPEMNASQLHDKLKTIGAELLVQTLDKIATKNITPIKQDLHASEWHKAPKLSADLLQINFHQSCVSIHNLVRGLSEYPCAFTFLPDGTRIKILHSSYSLEPVDAEPQTLSSDLKTYLGYVCQDGMLYIHELQPEGKKRMKIEEFLNGYKKKIEPFIL